MPQQSADFTHARLTVPKTELREAIRSIPQEIKRETKKVEALGAALARKPTPAASLEFSEAVCDWAAGRRVWIRLNSHHDQNALGKELCAWFQGIKGTHDVEEAIEPGRDIKGLGVSFASKHLRMLDPDRFAVLDSVLSEKLGFALTGAGYKLFMQALHDYQRRSFPKHTVGTLEMGIYHLVRPKKGAR